MIEIKHIKHHEIDLKKWDSVVLASQYPFVFAQSFYLNATCPNWEALIIGDYQSIFPLTVKTKWGFTYLPQPPFTSQLGVYGEINLQIEKAFYNYIAQHFKLIDLELNVSHQLKQSTIKPKVTYCINYKNNYQFNQNTKRNISKARQAGFQVLQVENNAILHLTQQYINPFLTSEVGLSPHTVSVLDRLILSAISHQHIVCFKVESVQGELKALVCFICNGKHAFYLKGNNFDKAENTGSMHLLLEHAIHYFSDKSILFDFGGGSKAGIANFYSGFGAELMTYGFLQINRLPWILKLIKKLNQM